MVNIQEIIGKVCPEAVFEENEVALAVVPDAKWHTVAETLKKAGYDWLACVVGEDWGRRSGLHLLYKVDIRLFYGFG